MDGYSLAGQRDYLKEWAEHEGMTVTGVYVDAGKSGKSINGREEFQRMLSDISTGTNPVDFVVVFRLSRFGRNAKDVLNSLPLLQRYGCNLISKEDGLDSSTAMGRMMITILGAVAEMERENILAQSMLGREQKAKDGGWNGGPAPFGYSLEKDGTKTRKLVINEEEAKIVRLIYDKFLNGGMGYSTIATYLNQMGIPRPPSATHKNRPYNDWNFQQVRDILHNEVYTGRITYGKTRQKRVEGSDNEYRKVRSSNYIRSHSISHEAIIDDDLFEKVRLRQQEITATSPKVGRGPKHLLAGSLRCPMCGSAMYAEVIRWKNKDGTERQTMNYQCGHHVKARNGNCKKNAISAEWVETEVIEYTRRLIHNPQFAADVQAQIGQQTNGPDLDAEIAGYKKQLKKLETSKSNLERDIDSITDEDRAAERKRRDMNARLNKLYEDIYSVEGQLDAAEQKKQAIAQNILTLDTVLKMLGAFDKMFDQMAAEDRRKLMETLIAEIQLHPKEMWQEGQSPIKTIKYTFPISREGVSAFMGESEFPSFGENDRCVVSNTGERKAVRQRLSSKILITKATGTVRSQA